MIWCVQYYQVYQMELWVLLAESQVLEQITPAVVNTLYKEQGSGHVVKMDSGQAKNLAVRSIQPTRLNNNINNNDLQVLLCVRYYKIYQMELWVLLAESQVLQQVTPATKNTILLEHGQGYAVKMEGGQVKNQPARVSFVNGQKIEPIFQIRLKRAEKIKI